MRKILFMILISIFSISFVYSDAYAAKGRTSKRAAKKMVNKSIKYIKKYGFKKALKVINVKNGKFHKGSTYVFVYNLKGFIIAHPANNKLVGRDMNSITDVDGKNFTKAFIKVAKSKKGRGWVRYRWTNPVTKKIDKKISYIKKVPGHNAFVGAGAYE